MTTQERISYILIYKTPFTHAGPEPGLANWRPTFWWAFLLSPHPFQRQRCSWKLLICHSANGRST